MANQTWIVAASADDGHWVSSAVRYTYNHVQFSRWVSGGQIIGRGFMRWAITIPDGSTIDSAYLKLYAQGQAGSAFTTGIKLVDSDSCPSLPNLAFDYAVTGNVNWSLGSWTADTWYTSPDIKTLVQAFIDRGGYSSGNYLGLRVDEGDASEDNQNKWFDSFDGFPDTAAKLEVTWTPPAATSIPVFMHHYGHHISKIIRG